MNRTVKITKKFENQTKSDPPKTWWSVYAGSDKYSIWDSKVAEVLEEGTEATVEFFTKNGYHTITAIVMANQQQAELTPDSLDQMFPDAKPSYPKVSPRKAEIPEVGNAIYERIQAYKVAATLVTAGNGEYRDIDKMADSALAYFYKQPLPTPISEPAPNVDEFLRSE